MTSGVAGGRDCYSESLTGNEIDARCLCRGASLITTCEQARPKIRPRSAPGHSGDLGTDSFTGSIDSFGYTHK